jgi:UDP-glucose 4-epimerase
MGDGFSGTAAGRDVAVIGCGFLGGNIARELALGGARLRVLSHSFAPLAVEVLDTRAMIAADVSDETALQHALGGAEEVVFCVGGLTPAAAERAPQVEAALLLDPLRRVLDALAGTNIRLTFLSSGGAVYGHPERLPVDESHPRQPIGHYGRVRVAAERMLDAARRLGIRVCVLRCSNVYGDGQPLVRGQGVVGVFVDRICRGEPIERFGLDDVVRDYLHARDLASAVCQLIQIPAVPTAINVGSGVGTSLTELIALIEDVVGRRALVVPRDGRSFDVRRVFLDVTRLRGLISFDPRPLRDGIEQIVAPAATPTAPAAAA